MSINGSALPDRYAVIGYPIEQSRSPAIHRRFAAQTGQYMVYGRISAQAEAFEREVHLFFSSGGSGLNVTTPHKAAALALADEATERAQLADAANTLMLQQNGRLLADNTDGAGLVQDLHGNLQIPLQNQYILIAGAGGAAAGVLGPLLAHSPRRIIIANRTVARAEALAQRFAHLGDVVASDYETLARHRADIVVNATSASLHGELAPIDPRVVRDTVCYDMSYTRGDTPFMRWARQHLCLQSVGGWGMLIEQAAESFRLWRGAEPDTGPVLELLMAGAYD